MRAVAEAGVILADLHEAVAGRGRRFPLTLGAKGSATIGGLVSTNAGGTQVLRFGPMRALVHGIEAVLPDGTFHEGLAGAQEGQSRLRPRAAADRRRRHARHRHRGEPEAGPGDRRARGRLARASPARRRRSTLLRPLEAADRRDRELRAGAAESLDPALEPYSRARARRSAGAIPGTCWSRRSPTAPTPSRRTSCSTRLLAPLIESGLVADAAIAASEAQAEAFWRLRDSISEAEREAFGPGAKHDISVAVDDMPRFMTEAAAEVEARFPGTRVAASAISATATSISTSAPASAAGRDWLEREGPAVTRLRPRSGHRRRRLDLGRARHRPDEDRRAGPAAIRTGCAIAGDQARARSAGPDESRAS